jgi:hypothetical protein
MQVFAWRMKLRSLKSKHLSRRVGCHKGPIGGAVGASGSFDFVVGEGCFRVCVSSISS